MLRGITVVLEGIKPIIKGIGDALGWIPKGFIQFLGGAAAVAGLLIGAAKIIRSSVFLLSGKEAFSKGFMGRATGAVKSTGGLATGGGLTSEQGIAAQAAGKGKMMTGVGVGAAAVGIGAGIGVAAAGINKLAEAMQKLDATQIAALPWVITSLGVAFAAFTVPLIFVTQAAAAGSVGLAGLGFAALGIGAGIGVAAAGVGYMAKGLSELVLAAKDSGNASWLWLAAH